jgi:hypothetical protein
VATDPLSMSRWTGRAPSWTRPRWTLSRSLVRQSAEGAVRTSSRMARPSRRAGIVVGLTRDAYCARGSLALWAVRTAQSNRVVESVWAHMELALPVVAVALYVIPCFFPPLVSVTYRLSLFVSLPPWLDESLFFNLACCFPFRQCTHLVCPSSLIVARLLFTLLPVSRVLSASARSRIIVWY